MDTVYKTGHQSSDDPFKFIMSTDAVDRQGDVIEQSGWRLADFRKNPIALFSHDARLPIGTWEDVKVEDGKLVGRLKMAAAGTSRLVDEVRSLLEQRILRAVSVGFSAEKAEPLDKDDDSMFGPLRFIKQHLLECSVVSVPANQEALMTRAKSMGISDETMNLLRGGGVPAQKPRSHTKGVPARSSKPDVTKGNKMSLNERIKAGETQLDVLRGALNTLVEESEGRNLTDGEIKQMDELGDQIDDQEKDLIALKSTEARLTKARSDLAGSTAATPVRSTPRPAHQRSAPARAIDPNERPGTLLVRAAVVKALAHAQKRSEADVLEERYGSDGRKDAINLLVTKAESNTATTTEPGWASELVSNDTRGWIADLEAVSLFGALAAAGTSMEFAGSNSVTVPSRDRSKKVASSWVGENATIPVRDAAFTSILLSRFKKAIISVYSEELMETSTPNIEAVLRDAIRVDTAESIDADLLDISAGVANVRPPSILNGQPTAVSSGNTLDNIHTDLRFLMDTMAAQNAGRNPIMWMNPARLSGLSLAVNSVGQYVFREEIERGTLMGYRLVTSTNVPQNLVGLTDAADFASAADAPQFRVSTEATLVMLDDDGVDPSIMDPNAVTVAGSVKVSDAAGVTGGPAKVKSMFQQYNQAIRQILPVTWSMARANTSPYLSAVNW